MTEVTLTIHGKPLLTHTCDDPDCHVPGFVKTVGIRLEEEQAKERKGVRR